MSERLAPSTYMIDSINFPGQYVSVGRDDAIVGRKKLNSIGGIQAVRLDCIFHILSLDHRDVVAAPLRLGRSCDVSRRVGFQGG
jgi:hypothetical protein